MTGLIAVHVGAGYHAECRRPTYKRVCKNACTVAMQKMQDGMDAIGAVAEAITVIEDCPFTNAGIGSNLALNGLVECDAGIMDGRTLHFGSVGALSNIKNPIKVAKKVLEEQRRGLLPGGRIPPCTIVGPGANEWALDNGFKFFDNQALSSKHSENSYVRNLSLLQKSITTSKHNKIPSDSDYVDETALLDTVGALCVDSSGNVASAVSSGGLLLKYSGRIGQAAVYGSGCWAENSSSSDIPGVACTVSGIGEYLIKTQFAKECCQTILSDPNSVTVVPETFRKKFLDSPCLQNITSKLAGVLALKYFTLEDYCELSWAHNTKTMILGYMSNISPKPIVIISAQPPSSKSCKNIVGSEICIKFS